MNNEPNTPSEYGGGDSGNNNNEAAIKLVGLTFETPDGRMSELTNIPLRQALPLSMTELFERVTKHNAEKLDKPENGKVTIPLQYSEIWRMSYYKHRRSVRGEHLMRISALCENEMAKEEEDPDRYIKEQ